jgi:Ser/Thr protein kinase RdoA (MazF antagonist)
MQHFPVSCSVLSSTHLGGFLRSVYPLGERATCTLIKTFVNDTYLITDGPERFIFRVYTLHWRSEKEIAEEIRLITMLKENDISVSYAIADTTGKYVQKIAAPEGERFGVLFSFAEGEKAYNPAAEIHYKVGEYMARLHRLTIDVRLERADYTAKVLLIESFEKFRSYIPVESDEMALMVSAQQRLLEELKKVDLAGIRQGAVHLDLWADNLHVGAAAHITLFDFDFCGNGWLCYDIAFYLLMLHGVEADAAGYEKKKESFLKGYESVTTISDEERRILPALGTSLCFFYMGIQRERFATVFFNEEHVKRYINFRIKRWMDFTSATVY